MNESMNDREEKYFIKGWKRTKELGKNFKQIIMWVDKVELRME